MSGLETAIRQALERADRASPETRARIYQSARNALENGLRKQDVHDPDMVAQQRHRLEVVIHGIENEERAALRENEEPAALRATTVEPPSASEARPVSQSDAVSPPVVRANDRLPPAGDSAVSAAPPVETALDDLRLAREDSLRGDTRPPVTPVVKEGRRDRKRGSQTGHDGGRKPRRSRRSRLLSLFMVAATLVAAFGTAAWWAETSGLLKSPAERDTAVANPPTTVRSEDFDGSQGLKTLGSEAGFSGAWVSVMDAAGDSSVTAGDRSTISPVTDDRGPRLRITSASPEADGAVSIAVPVDVLQQLSGKTSTLALTVQSDTGKPAQFSVACDFASLGDCGRHRFTVNDEKSDMLFKVSFRQSLTPTAPGHLLINSDVTGAGGAINLYAVRVLPGQ